MTVAIIKSQVFVIHISRAGWDIASVSNCAFSVKETPFFFLLFLGGVGAGHIGAELCGPTRIGEKIHRI